MPQSHEFDDSKPTYSAQAQRYLDQQATKQINRIEKSINLLPAGDVKKLKGIKNAYRLRIGSVRVLFSKEGNKIHVVKIDNRGDVYKRKGENNEREKSIDYNT